MAILVNALFFIAGLLVLAKLDLSRPKSSVQLPE
jgi:hypothetical protein